MTEFTTKSGAQAIVNVAPWKDAKVLKMVIEREAARRGISLDANNEQVFALVLGISGSPEFDMAVWPCLTRCSLNSEKITENTFDKKEARRDYFEIMLACVKENLGPLVENLFSLFGDHMGKKKPESDSPS